MTSLLSHILTAFTQWQPLASGGLGSVGENFNVSMFTLYPPAKIQNEKSLSFEL